MTKRQKTLIIFVIGLLFGLVRADRPWVGDGVVYDLFYVVASGLIAAFLYLMYRGVVVVGRKLTGNTRRD